MAIRAAAVAGTWYPGSAGALTQDVDDYLASAEAPGDGQIRAIVSPHAGLMFSGPVAAWAYKAAAAEPFDLAVLVGPSHFAGFDGVALWPDGAFATPLGPVTVDEEAASALAAFPVVRPLPAVHEREHSLEMQLPFIARVFPGLRIVPMLMGYQHRATIEALATAIGTVCAGRRALLVASTDLSHYFDATRAAELDGEVQRCVSRFDPEALLERFEEYPERERGRFVACGGGPAIAVMMAARALGATAGRVLRYGHSGEISGDDTAVVGYLAAAFGTFRVEKGEAS
jgi:AmmeMemoRadiSam system protein B